MERKEHLKELNINQNGENNRNWKGGRVKHQGYIQIRIGEKYINEHVLIMEEKLGRKLEPYEIVHHIDEDRENNNINNLKLMKDSEHKSYHKLKFWRKRKSVSTCT